MFKVKNELFTVHLVNEERRMYATQLVLAGNEKSAMRKAAQTREGFKAESAVRRVA